MNQVSYDCVIVGGGAAGLMCAANAGQRGLRVAVLDHANKVGKKILMSGGGRCNFTNLYVEPSNYISNNPHFCKSALSRYTQYDFLDLVNRYDLAYHEKTQGQLFCDNKAKDILNILLAECDKAGVKIHTHCEINCVEKEEHFILQTSLGKITSNSLVIASGGLSIPTMGASGFGYKLAKQFGIDVLPTRASLVPFTLSGRWLEVAKSLSGVSVEVDIQTGNTHFKDFMLFTHRGLSGPAILQLSNYWQESNAVTINFLPQHNIEEMLTEWKTKQSKAELKNLLSEIIPKRFAQAWLDQENLNKPVNQYQHAEIDKLRTCFEHWKTIPAGTEGYRTAEVTIGGVNTDEISSKTFESKKVPGLFFIGEVLDVTGWLGGFNFQWAWSSGYCAAQHV